MLKKIIVLVILASAILALPYLLIVSTGEQITPSMVKNSILARPESLGNFPLPAPTPPLTQITISREQVNLRNSAGVVEVAIQGDTFTGACDGTWCYIGNGRRVWQACTNQRYWADYEVCR